MFLERRGWPDPRSLLAAVPLIKSALPAAEEMFYFRARVANGKCPVPEDFKDPPQCCGGRACCDSIRSCSSVITRRAWLRCRMLTVKGRFIMRSQRILLLLVALAAPAATCASAQRMEAANGGGQSAALIPDFSGQWGRDMLFFEPPPSGPGPVINSVRNADGTMVAPTHAVRLCKRWLGDHTSPILKPEAAEAVKKFGDLAFSGKVTPDLHNSCWPEPPPYVMALHFGVLILQRRDEVTLLYLLYNTVRHVRLNVPHPENLTPSLQGHSVGRYESDTLVIDTVGIEVAPLLTVMLLAPPTARRFMSSSATA